MDKTLNIIYFNYMQDLYGSSIGSTIKAERLLENLQALGHQIHQYWRYRNIDILQNHSKQRSGWSIKPLLRRLFFTPKEMLKNLVEMVKEYRYIKQHHPDVIILRIDAYRFSVALLCRMLNIPLVVEADGANSYEWLTFNNRDGNIWKSWLLGIENFCFHVAQGVFVQSNISKQYFSELYPKEQHKITVITNAANIREQSGAVEIRQQLAIPQQAIVCGFLGSMHYWHNTGLLIDMLEKVMPVLPDFYMVLVGSGGPMAESLQERCSQYNWHNRVLFTGHIEHAQTHHYINMMDIALAPYAASNMFYFSPVKIFEYMAQGRAVITTPVGQIEELIKDGVNGLFFDPDLVGDLPAKVRQLYHDPDMRTRIGENARHTIELEHTWAHKAAQLQAICLAAVTEGMVESGTEANVEMQN